MMADIKQAAKWMNEGENVKRPDSENDGTYASDDSGFVLRNGQDIAWLQTTDLLAEDWELA
jgi:hypothetical protein